MGLMHFKKITGPNKIDLLDVALYPLKKKKKEDKWPHK